MVRWLRSLFAWRLVEDTRIHCYWQNAVTGRRHISRIGTGYQPVDEHWLKTGEWGKPDNPPGSVPPPR